MTEYKQKRKNYNCAESETQKAITFHFGVDFNLWIIGYLTGPPGSAVEFGPHDLSNRVLYAGKWPLLWAVGLRIKETPMALKKNLLYA